MKISEMCELLQAAIVSGSEELLAQQVHSAFAGDLMSDVLAYADNQEVLITGLANPQVVRTAEMMDMCCIVLIRGKKAASEMVSLADHSGIVLLQTELTMYECCGLLYCLDLQEQKQ